MKRAKLVRALFLRLSQEDAEALEKTAGQLKLSVSEIARRGIRVGVRSLAMARLPGGETDFSR